MKVLISISIACLALAAIEAGRFNAPERQEVGHIRVQIRQDIGVINDIKANISSLRGQVINKKREAKQLRATGGDPAVIAGLWDDVKEGHEQLDFLIRQKIAYRVRLVCCRECIFEFEAERDAAQLDGCWRVCFNETVIPTE